MNLTQMTIISTTVGRNPLEEMAAFASNSPAFHMMYSAYKLNKQGDNMQEYVNTPFPIWN